MDSSGLGRDPLEVLAAEFLERERRGETPSVEEYARRCPERADEIRELFPALGVLESLKPSPDDSSATVDPPAGSTTDGGPRPSGATGATLLEPGQRVGDYRIVGFLGRGGMGEVYEAEHQSLRRQVALKILAPHASANPLFQERFRREARAAARLHHTNIVPVFEDGQDGDIRYYAMQFIRGQGLNDVIEEVARLRDAGSQPPRHETLSDSNGRPEARARPAIDLLARSLQTGCWTPRDVDPSGPIPAPVPIPIASETRLDPASTEAAPEPHAGSAPPPRGPAATPVTLPGRSSDRPYTRSVAQVGRQVAEALAYAHARGVLHRDIKPSNLLLDAAGVVWVADFGLAKLADEGDLTATQDILGTLRYMAPERFRGECDARADLYGLGLTLHERLTLRPAFDAADKLGLIGQIQHRGVARPRVLDPRIPRDLETIVLKAIERDPVHRYQTAEAMARDLQLFLEDRSITIRRTPWHERTWRWCRRNRSLAGLISSVALLLLVIAVGSSAMSLRLREALDRSNRDRNALVSEVRKEKEILYASHRSEARALRYSRRTGQRFASLDALKKATLLGRELKLPPGEFDTLRDEAIASLALVDLRPSIGMLGAVPRITSASWYFAFHPTLRIVATYLDGQGTIGIYRVEDGREMARLPGFTAYNYHLTFSPDGRYLAAWKPGQVRVWRLSPPDPEGRPILDVPADLGWAGNDTRSFDLFSPDSRRLALSHSDGTLVLHDLADGRPIRRLELGGDWVRNARFWQAGTGELLLTDVKFYFCESFRTTGLLNGRVNVESWEVATGREYRTLVSERQPDGKYSHPAISPDGRLLAVGRERPGGVNLWDLDRGTELGSLSTGDTRVVLFEPSGALLTYGDPGVQRWPIRFDAGPDATLRVGPAQTLAPPRFTGHDHWIAQSRDGRVLAQAFGDGALVHRQDRPGRPLALKPHADCRYVAVSPDGHWIATGSHGHSDVKVWDGQTGQLVKVIDKGNGRVAFSPDGRWLADGGFLCAVGSWAKGPAVGQWPCFSPDGAILASDSDEGVMLLYETKSGRILARLEDPNQDRGVHATFSPDGTRLVATNNDSKSIHIWDLRRLRRELAAMGLDWDQPPYPEPEPGPDPRSETGSESEPDCPRREHQPG